MLPYERLCVLLEVMQNVIATKPPAAFDFGTWWLQYDTKEAFADKEEIPIERVPECRTIACVAGWGASDPRLQADGLGISFGRYYNEIRIHHEFAETEDFGEFFGITEDEASNLFFEGPPDHLRYDDNDNEIPVTAQEITTYLKGLVDTYKPQVPA